MMNTEWAVTLELEVLDGLTEDEDLADVADAALDLFEDMAADRGTAIAVEVDGLSMTLTGFGRTAIEGMSDALEVTSKVFTKLGYDLDVTDAHVRTYEALETESQRIKVPPLAGLAEVAELLGVSKARVGELARDERLPSPVARLAAGPVWVEPEIHTFAETWSRRPGRPRSTAVAVRE